MPQVYQEPLCRRHFASVVSEAWCFRAFVFIATIILSLVIAYNTGGFWLKTSTSIEQPTVHYTWDALLLLEGSQAGQEQIWSSNPGIAVAFSSQSIAVNIEVTEEDYNFDGKPDQIRFRATAQSLQQVYSAKLLLQFSYQLQSAARLRMYSLAYVSYSSAVPGAALVTDGQLELQQGAPLPEASYHGVYNSPILNSTSSMTAAVPVAATLQLSEILKVYLDRNITTRYTNDYPVWQAGSSANSEFVLDVRVRVPSNQVVLYRPSVAQMLKVGWIQFLCIFFILWWGLSWFERQVFRYRVLETRVVSDIQPKQLRF